MDEEAAKKAPDHALAGLLKDDIYDLSVEDLEERIGNLKLEIARCEKAIAARTDTRAAAEKLFKL